MNKFDLSLIGYNYSKRIENTIIGQIMGFGPILGRYRWVGCEWRIGAISLSIGALINAPAVSLGVSGKYPNL